MEELSSQPNDTNSGEAEVLGLRQLSCGYIADNIVDDFVEDVVINIVLLLELFQHRLFLAKDRRIWID